jgi:4-hydroxy-tetrahydrodipicolinate reductase
MKIGICGVCGRMGVAILRILLEKGHEISAAFDHAGRPEIGRDAGTLVQGKDLGVAVTVINEESLKKCDCLIDFSSPAATMELLPLAVKNGKALVVGTTGFTDEQKSAIERAGHDTPVVFAPNMAVGVNVLFKLTEMASRVLGPEFDVEVLESHHRFKKDAPSGTAKELVKIIKDNMRGMRDAAEVNGREGITGERTNKEIGIMAIRGGDIVGEHTVYFIGKGERIELTIRSTSRENLATGAVLAGEFLPGKAAGLYTMYDVLGLK